MATFVTHDGVELAYEDRGGDAFPLVMLHGWGQTQAMFRHQLSDLAPDRRIVTLDMRGHGRSAKPHFGYRIARFSRDVYSCSTTSVWTASTRWAGRWASRSGGASSISTARTESAGSSR
jgi:pimeloyl-ACP methyl ester carboxylesterase